MKKFLALFNKVGGKEILRQYWQSHVLFFALLQTALQGFTKKSLEIVRLSVNNKILGKLRKKYRKTVSEFLEQYTPQPRRRSNKVWVCWFQGMEKAPALVQKCYQSLQDNLTDREIILLTLDNYKDYVNLPDHIQKKADAGIIPPAQFSDLLRLELLIRHGGTWIDATVFCSGGNIPNCMLDSELFSFQTLKPGLDGHPTSLSNWFISAYTNHPLLLLTQHLLYAYWARNNKMVDYFIFHDFFQIATEALPQEWSKVIPFCNSTPHILLLRLFDTYDEATWAAIRAQTPFHKLTYKFTEEQASLANTYYEKLLK